MLEYHVIMTVSKDGKYALTTVKPDEYSVTVSVPDLVENVTEYVREEYPESSIVYIAPKGF